MKSVILIIILILIVLLALSMIYSFIKIDISRYNIKSKKIDKNIRIIFLSDLHNRKSIKKIVEIVKNEKPDIIINGGDMINENLNELDNFFNLCKSLNKFKMYYIYGNHETRLSDEDYEKYNKIIKNTSNIVLNNKKDSLSNNIELIGFVSDIDCYKNFHKLCLSKEYIFDKVNEFDKKKFNILVAHNPLEFESYVETNADLVLSGHVHGGLVNLPIFGSLLSPDCTFFPKYSKGEYNKKNTKMIVSRGLGFSKRIPFRVNNPGEIVIIDLIKD